MRKLIRASDRQVLTHYLRSRRVDSDGTCATSIALALARRAAWTRKSYDAQLRLAISVLEECLELETQKQEKAGEGAA